jgi:hypothetical protein
MTTPFFLTTCAVSLCAIALIWFFPISSLFKDNFRADIRRLRDELFDFMWENGFSFETAAYRDTRQFLNGLLRASNFMSPAMLLLGLFYYVWYGMNKDRQLTDFSSCPPKLREKLEKTTTASIKRLEVLMFRRSILGLGIYLFVWTMVAAIKGRQRLKETIDNAARQLAIDTYFLGAPVSELSFSNRNLLRC